MTFIETLAESGPLLRDAVRSGNLRVLASMLGPAFRGLVQKRGRNEESTPMGLEYPAHFDWRYARSQPQMARLYQAAKTSQWNASTDLDWSVSVDPQSTERLLIPDRLLPMAGYPGFERLPPEEKNRQRHAT